MAVLPFTGPQRDAAAGTIGVGLPSDYDTTQATPAAFGAAQGQAAQQLGAATDQFGNTLFDQARQFAATNATNALTQLRQQETAIRYGNPADSTAPAGYLTQQGANAMSGYQPALDRLQKARDDIAATLDPLAAKQFQAQSSRFLADTQATYDGHRAVQQQAWQVSSLDTNATTLKSVAIAHASDPDAFNHALADGRNAVISKGNLLGWGPDIISGQLQSYTSGVRRGVVEQMRQTNPLAAQAYLDANQGDFTAPDLLETQEHLRPAVMQWGVRSQDQALMSQYGGASGGYLAPAAPGSIQPVAPEARADMLNKAVAGTMVPAQLLGAQVMQESGWDQGRTGASGDMGLMQVLPSTAAAPGYGMDGVDPAVLRSDPAANLSFGARYLEARGKAAGLTTPADWADPVKVSTALNSYNGGGTPGYAGKVLRFLPPGGLGGPGAPSNPNATGGVKPMAIGDSLAAGAAQANAYSGGGVVSAHPDDILTRINSIPLTGPGSIPHGTPVVLSSGISNSPDPAQLAVVQQQIASLKARGVADIRLVGTGTRADLARLSGPLADLAKNTPGVTFLGPLTGPMDAQGVHPLNYKGLGSLPGGGATSGQPAAGTTPAAAPGATPATASGPPPAGSPEPDWSGMMQAASTALDPYGQPNPQYQEMLMGRIRARQQLYSYAREQSARNAKDVLTAGLLGQTADGKALPPPSPSGVLPMPSPTLPPGQAPAVAMPPPDAPQPQLAGQPAAGVPAGAVPGATSTPPTPVNARQLPTDLNTLLVTPDLVRAWGQATPEIQKSVLATLDHNSRTGAGRDANTFGPGFIQAFQRAHLPDGDPNRLTDPTTLLPLVGQPNGITVAGLDKLRGEINGRGTPETEADSAMRGQFFRNARSQISGADDGLGLKDPKGDDLMLRFMAQAYPAIEAAKAKGLTAAQLYNPDSPDYVGKAIPTFKRSLAQRTADMVGANGDDAPAPAPPNQPGFFSRLFGGGQPPPLDLSSPAAIKAARDSGQISQQEAVQRLIGQFTLPSADTGQDNASLPSTAPGTGPRPGKGALPNAATE